MLVDGASLFPTGRGHLSERFYIVFNNLQRNRLHFSRISRLGAARKRLPTLANGMDRPICGMEMTGFRAAIESRTGSSMREATVDSRDRPEHPLDSLGFTFFGSS